MSPGLFEGPLTLFRSRAFVIIWSSGAISSSVRWLELLAVGVYVFDVTGSALQVALMTILRMAPLAILGLFAGAIAERIDRRRILMLGYALMAVLSTVLGVLAVTGQLAVWQVGLGAFLNGVFWSTDLPARRTLLGEAAGKDLVGTAMSLDSVTSNGTRMLGPIVGGVMLQWLGLEGAYFVGTVCYTVGILSLLRLAPSPVAEGLPTRVWLSVRDGVRHVRANRALTGTLAVTIVFNLWAFPVTSMVPVIGREVLSLSAFPVGLLMGAEGAGALLGAIGIAAAARASHFRKLYFYGVFLYLDMVLLFSHSTNPWLSGTLLFVMGFGGAAFASMQATLVFLSAEPAYRGRVMGVLTVCIGTGPIGFAHLGFLADALGAPLATAIMAAEGIAALLIAYLLWPEIE